MGLLKEPRQVSFEQCIECLTVSAVPLLEELGLLIVSDSGTHINENLSHPSQAPWGMPQGA